MNDDYVSRMVRRRVGLDALRRLRRRVDAERAREAGEARLARRLAMAIAVLAGLTLLFFLLR
ncbi:MAG: hypothetical protein KJZ92_03700 [Rhodocyclaceae bacterium]|jgi:hypothetical protein|nr:hypothetical protein [Rhodocyclaceae bacterium]MCC6880439.1 hypothetical protein [Rhodocyclaceae bacterium]MCL4680355.1 hypothetical protein [Rhodocyclaceae bacterium]